MEDVEALRLLTEEIQRLQTLPNPPPSYDGIEKFNKMTTEVIDHVLETTQKVDRYRKAIDAKMEEMQSALKNSTKKIEEQNKKTLDSIKERDAAEDPARARAGRTLLRNVGTNGKFSSKDMEYMLMLQNLEIKKQRLEEFLIKTQKVMEKVKQGTSVTNSDTEQLRGCLGSYLEDKKESYQEEQDCLANERNKREEEKRKLKEEEERKREEEERKRKKNNKKEDGERRKKEEDERLKREEEERLKPEEEDRTRKKEDRKRKEEDDRINKKEEERWKREEEEIKRKEEHRLREEDEDRRNKEKEQWKREEEERKRKKEDTKRKEEDDRIRWKREEEERKRKEEEDRKRDKEEDRINKEEEERWKREEEDRKRKVEEDRKRKEVEYRINKEEEERWKREEEDRKRKVEEDRKRKEEEDRINKEMERTRREEEERKKREAKKKEEEDRKRKDPANWTPHIYRRPDGESDSFHSDICCHVLTMPETLQEEDSECLASDEWRDNEGPTLAIGEKLASSLTEVKVKEDDKDLKVPMRIYVPHCSVSDSNDEVIVKASIDGGEWTNLHPVTIPARQTSQTGLNCAAIDVPNFHTVKVLAVAKTRSEELVVNKNGIRKTSTLDKNIKLFAPRDTFHKPQKMKLEIRPITDNSLSFATQYYDHCHNVLSTSSVMTITCESPTEKAIELDLTRNAPNDKAKRDKGRYLHMYKCRGDNWKIAESEIKGKNMDVSINLPSRKDSYVVLEIEGKLGIPNEEFIKAADELYFHSNASIVRVVAKQRADNPHILMIQCVRREQVSSRLSELERQGYSLGADTSKEFVLIDGQVIFLRCSGNITMTPESEVKIMFHAYMDTAKTEVILQAVDEYKQKEFEGYVGYLQFEVLKHNREGALYIKTTGSLPIKLPSVHI